MSECHKSAYETHGCYVIHEQKTEKEVPRFALLEEAIHDFIGKKEHIDTRAKTDRDVSLLKKLFFKGR